VVGDDKSYYGKPIYTTAPKLDIMTEADMLKWAKEYAREQGWVLNIDEKQRDTVIKGLVRNKTKFGYAYCPCRVRSGDVEEDKSIVCPCVHHKEEVVREGRCKCRLFWKGGV